MGAMRPQPLTVDWPAAQDYQLYAVQHSSRRAAAAAGEQRVQGKGTVPVADHAMAAYLHPIAMRYTTGCLTGGPEKSVRSQCRAQA